MKWSDWVGLALLALSYHHLKRRDDMGNEPKELTELVDLVVDAVVDGVEAGKDGFQVTDVTKFANLLPELLPAIQGLNLIPSEIKSMTFDEGSALVQHVVGRLGVSSTHAIGIVQASLKLATSAYELVVAIKAPA